TLECLSDLKLDQLLSGELPGDREQVARAHLAVCPACAARSLELSADRARFAEVAPALDLARGSRSAAVARGPSGAARNVSARRWVGGMALAVAAMLALGVGLTEMLRERGELAGLSPRSAGTTRTKGNGVHFGFVVRRGEHTFAGEAGQTLHPGDLLRFTWSPGSPVYVGVWGIDGEGRVSAYQQSPELERLPAGQSQPLSGAVELDESLGEERLVAVQCNAPHSVRDITLALATSAVAAPLPADCVSESLVIVKVAP
ncbi:MAG TPA: zf-HC2 domain-containing protein, partial [Polyangiaceae bacterium]|nr:zf-HC2 domain-containing protein [Polyangiaceae bacterium]